jgi:hypothetical protein
MKTFKSHLKESLRNEKFKELFEVEKKLLDVALCLKEKQKNVGRARVKKQLVKA